MLINMEPLVNLEISLFFPQDYQKYKNDNVNQGAFTNIFSLGNKGIKLELIASSWKCNNIRSPMNKDFPTESDDQFRSVKIRCKGVKNISPRTRDISQLKILSMRNPIHPWRHRRLDHLSIFLIKVTGSTHHEIFVSISGQFDEWPRLDPDFPRSSYTITIPESIQPVPSLE